MSEAPEERLLQLTAYLLKRGEAVTFEEIRAQLPELYQGKDDAVDKKWTRDKAALEQAGVPIRFVQEGCDGQDGYLIDPRAYELRDLGLSRDEAAVLWTAGQAAAAMAENPWRDELQSALRKLRAGCRDLPARAPHLMVRHGDKTARRKVAGWLEDVGEAVRRRKRVSIEYFTGARREVQRREVDVYGFAWRRGVWLFAGWCHLRQARRVFYVDRLRSLTVNRKKPSEADYAIPRDFDIQVFSRQQPWDYWVHEAREASVRLTGQLAPLAGQLLPGAKVKRQRDGSALATLQVTNLPALVRQALSLGPEAEIVSPEEARAQARACLGQLEARLSQPSGEAA
ncbi:MAG TPA: WYL domain-containing protein [Anaeromyxobacteraceae bacterium]|jgi:proteasome accessory factor B|nr:WYL domain-containing protein [Anaeromyxobacteraceae bacterium]